MNKKKPEKRFCPDCSYYSPGGAISYVGWPPSCRHPEARHVTGEYFSLSEMRQHKSLCGQAGKYWQKKPDKPVNPPEPQKRHWWRSI